MSLSTGRVAMTFTKSARLLRPGSWLAVLGAERAPKSTMTIPSARRWTLCGSRMVTQAAPRRPSDPEAIAATGLFGTPACLTDRQQAILPAGDVIALESTRATFLSWPRDHPGRFTDGPLFEPQPAVAPDPGDTSVAMAQVVLRDRS